MLCVCVCVCGVCVWGGGGWEDLVEKFERRDEAHMGFSERMHTILN